MHVLSNGAMSYDWGSTSAIPQFVGAPPSAVPVAEIWIGTHDMNPSRVTSPDGGAPPLSEIAGDLPFLVKLLAAAKPLSLQVHPGKSLAEAGYALEEAAGIAVDAPERSFRDRNAKAEMVYALSSFEALIGFRPTAEILRVLSLLDTDLTNRLADDLRSDPGYAGIVRRVEWLLTEGVGRDAVRTVVRRCHDLAHQGLDVRRACATALTVADHHPDDVGIVIALLMNRMTLQPGEAAFLETGVLHAYLSGLALEVMVNSDNVLRAGLTSKHVDPAGLVECLHQGMSRVARVTPEIIDAETEVFAPAGVSFALAVMQLSGTNRGAVEIQGSARSVVVCTGGTVTLTNDAGDEVRLRRGESAYLAPDDGRVTASGLGEIVQARSADLGASGSRMVDIL